jgi:CII-binding regulator of phage lambda lysogenization HflD
MIDVTTIADLRLLARILDEEGKHERAHQVRRYASDELTRLEAHLADSWRTLDRIGPPLREQAEAVQAAIEQVLRDLAELFPDLAPEADP